MNDIQSLIDRQLGIQCRLNYDNVLKRLVCEDESFYGLQAADVPVGSFDQDPPIFACRFAEAAGYECVLALANEDGRVAIQDTTSARTAKQLESFQCHNNAVFDLVWMPQHLNFVTVSGDHSACLWDVSDGTPRRIQSFCGHVKSVKTAAFSAAPAVFATGGRDGTVLLWDARAGAAPQLRPGASPRPDNALGGCHAPPAPRTPGRKRARPHPRATSITGLAFQDATTLLSCGECDGNIKAWDLRKNYSLHTRDPLPKHSIPYCGGSAKNGYTNLLMDRSGVRLYASCMDDVIYCFNVATYSTLPERRYIGHENGTFYIKASLSGDGRYLVSGSSDKLAYIWSLGRQDALCRLAAHRAEVTCAAWRAAGEVQLVTCGDDARHLLWRVGREEPATTPGSTPAGRAEPAPRAPPASWVQHSTPTSHKRRDPTFTPVDSTRTPAEPTHSHNRKTKRCLKDLFTNGCVEEAESTVKRMKLNDNENNENDNLPRTGTKRAYPGGEENRESPKRRASGEGETSLDWTYPVQAGTSFLTPTKNYEAKSCRLISPKNLKRMSPLGSPESPNKIRVVSVTPTKDLPDFVRSGEAPHLSLMSPVKKKQDTTDWLTLLREKRGKEGDKPLPTPLSPRDNFPPRRGSMERTPKSNKKNRTLLKYFTVTAKDK